MSQYDILHAQQAQQAKKDSLLNNQARNCVQAITYNTRGSGYLVVQAPLVFPVRFLQEPQFSFGSQLVKAPNATTFALPVCTVGVTSWVTEPNGANPKSPFYVGASIYVSVQVNPINSDNVYGNSPDCVVNHHLRFEGVAMKVLPPGVIDGLTSSGDLDTNTPNYGSS